MSWIIYKYFNTEKSGIEAPVRAMMLRMYMKRHKGYIKKGTI
jgi:hypothetical protein